MVDISETIELKVQSLRAHASQMGDWDPSEMIYKWAAEAAESYPFSHGETFRYLKLD
jgi:LmbE family N-acetylglucosaminyl deacetylase